MVHRLLALKVEVVVFICLVVGEWLLIHDNAYVLALTLLVATCLTLVTSYLKKAYWLKALLLTTVYVVTLISSGIEPLATPSGMLYALVVSSFIAVRVSYQLGLLYCCLSVIGHVPIVILHWSIWSNWDHILFYSVLGAMGVLSLQLYEVANKFHQYRKLSIYDELTGLHNVRYFRFKLDKLYRDPKLQTICLCLIDLDKFKSVNDVLGHREGDHVLRRTAEILEKSAKPMVVSRYGGEEFVILLPNYSLEQAVAFANGLRESLQSVSLCLLPITLSCGISIVHHGDKSPEQLFDEADKALYLAKQNRNEVLAFTISDEEIAATEW